MKKLLPSILLLMLFSLPGISQTQDVIQKKGLYVSRESGKPYSGVIKETDTEGRILTEIEVKEGKLEGNTTLFFPSGNKKEIRSYHDGKKEGTWVTWDNSGKKTAEASFKDGKKDGFWYIWDDRGIKRYEMFYQNGEKRGTWTIWDENGTIISKEEFK